MRLIAERADVIAALGEVFRDHGFDGASLARITQATGLGKGSLYHFFPDGKEDMARAVVAAIGEWFEQQVFTPLATASAPRQAVAESFAAVEAYFHSGRRVCLIGAFALADARDRFAVAVRGYFLRWRAVLAAALTHAGLAADPAAALAEDALAAIQGGLVLARALDEPAAFTRILNRWAGRLDAAMADRAEHEKGHYE